MTYIAKSLADLLAGDQVQFALDEEKHPPIEVATWTSYDRDAVCVGDNVFEALTRMNYPNNHYLWFTGVVAYRGEDSLHVVPEHWEYERGVKGYALYAADVMEVDLVANETFAAIVVDNRDAPPSEDEMQLALFPYPPGTIFMGATGSFPLAVVDRKGKVRVLVTSDGLPRDGAAEDFDAALLDSEWGRLWRRVVVTDVPADVYLNQGLELLDYAIGITEDNE